MPQAEHMNAMCPENLLFLVINDLKQKLSLFAGDLEVTEDISQDLEAVKRLATV